MIARARIGVGATEERQQRHQIIWWQQRHQIIWWQQRQF